MGADLQKIAAACVVECERQHVDIHALGNLILAYDYAVTCSLEPPWFAAVLRLGTLVEPEVNTHGFRITPVTFTGGGAAVRPRQIPQAMQRLDESVGVLTAHEYTHEFLKIHPFKDGNGRVAFVLYNWMSGTLDSPQPLPEFEF